MLDEAGREPETECVNGGTVICWCRTLVTDNHIEFPYYFHTNIGGTRGELCRETKVGHFVLGEGLYTPPGGISVHQKLPLVGLYSHPSSFQTRTALVSDEQNSISHPPSHWRF
jgi:hypothetical protein